jgi:hypothetical protein
MASIIKIKRSAVTGQAPTTSQLQAGELAINTTDGVMYSANSTAVFEVGANLSSLSINSISFPTTDGNNGQAIITDGNGNLTFGNVATQSSNVVLTANATINSYIFSITANTTQISGTDDNSKTLVYLAGDEDVFVNGVKVVKDQDYTATNSTMITMSSNVVSGDVVEVLTIRNLYEKVEYLFTISGTPTTVSGNDDNNKTLSYNNGRELVYVNGLKQVPGTDYTATNTSVITFTSALSASDVVEIIALPLIAQDLTQPVSYSSSNTDILTIDTFAAAGYRTAKYIVQANSSSDYHSSEVVLVHNGTDVQLTEYASVATSNLYSLTADIDSGNVRLRATPSGSGTTFKNKRILIEV